MNRDASYLAQFDGESLADDSCSVLRVEFAGGPAGNLVHGGWFGCGARTGGATLVPAPEIERPFRRVSPVVYEVSSNTGGCGAMPRTRAVSSAVIESNTKARKHSRIRSQRSRFVPSFFQAAWNTGQHSCCV